jgi:hypothetical protein
VGWSAISSAKCSSRCGSSPTPCSTSSRSLVQLADGSVEPGPGGVHDHGGGVADDLGDGHAVAHLLAAVRRVWLTGRGPAP